MPTSWKSALLLSGCVLPVGCTSADVEDAGSELASTQSSLALLSVERSVDPDSELLHVAASAKVARFRGIDGEGLLKLLGAEPRELETCSGGASIDDKAVSAQAQVDLLSVGPIAVRIGALQHRLTPRLFPALATTAAGFFYAGALESAELAASAANITSDNFNLQAPGERGLGKFEIGGTAPSEVRALAIGGVILEAGSALPRSVDAELTWEPEGQGDRIELEFFSGGSSLACAARDDGHFVLPAAQLKALDADDNASLVMRRVRVAPVDMSGVESAYLRVAAARTLTIQVK